MILSETWRAVPGYEGRYEVSDYGHVRSIGILGNGQAGQLLKLRRPNPRDPYVQATLYQDGKRRLHLVHRLVMAAFVGPLPDGHEVNHLDGDGGNNRRGNLEYVTRSENLRHAFRIGHMDTRGARNPAARLNASQVARIRNQPAVTGAALARELGVAQSTISAVRRGRTWSQPHDYE